MSAGTVVWPFAVIVDSAMSLLLTVMRMAMRGPQGWPCGRALPSTPPKPPPSRGKEATRYRQTAAWRPDFPSSGAVTVIHRFGSTTKLKIHLQCGWLDGGTRAALKGQGNSSNWPRRSMKRGRRWSSHAATSPGNSASATRVFTSPWKLRPPVAQPPDPLERGVFQADDARKRRCGAGQGAGIDRWRHQRSQGSRDAVVGHGSAREKPPRLTLRGRGSDPGRDAQRTLPFFQASSSVS